MTTRTPRHSLEGDFSVVIGVELLDRFSHVLVAQVRPHRHHQVLPQRQQTSEKRKAIKRRREDEVIEKRQGASLQKKGIRRGGEDNARVITEGKKKVPT